MSELRLARELKPGDHYLIPFSNGEGVAKVQSVSEFDLAEIGGFGRGIEVGVYMIGSKVETRFARLRYWLDQLSINDEVKIVKRRRE